MSLAQVTSGLGVQDVATGVQLQPREAQDANASSGPFPCYSWAERF